MIDTKRALRDRVAGLEKRVDEIKSGSEDTGTESEVADCRILVERGGETVASGVELPSGTVVVEWDPTTFPAGERTAEPTQSIYGSIDDAIEATGADVIRRQAIPEPEAYDG